MEWEVEAGSRIFNQYSKVESVKSERWGAALQGVIFSAGKVEVASSRFPRSISGKMPLQPCNNLALKITPRCRNGKPISYLFWYLDLAGITLSFDCYRTFSSLARCQILNFCLWVSFSLRTPGPAQEIESGWRS